MDFQIAKFVLDLVVLVVLPVTGWLVVRVLKGIDTNQQQIANSLAKLWEHHDGLSKDFYELRGAHEVNHNRRASDRQER